MVVWFQINCNLYKKEQELVYSKQLSEIKKEIHANFWTGTQEVNWKVKGSYITELHENKKQS